MPDRLDVENCAHAAPRIIDPVPTDVGPALLFFDAFAMGQLATFTALDLLDDTLSFRLFGEDADLLELDPATGVLSLEAPVPGIKRSFDTDRIEEVIVLVEDAAGRADVMEIELPLITVA